MVQGGGQQPSTKHQAPSTREAIDSRDSLTATRRGSYRRSGCGSGCVVWAGASICLTMAWNLESVFVGVQRQEKGGRWGGHQCGTRCCLGGKDSRHWVELPSLALPWENLAVRAFHPPWSLLPGVISHSQLAPEPEQEQLQHQHLHLHLQHLPQQQPTAGRVCPVLSCPVPPLASTSLGPVQSTSTRLASPHLNSPHLTSLTHFTICLTPSNTNCPASARGASSVRVSSLLLRLG